MDNQTEVIKQQMVETRESLAEKLETLEDKVVDTVHGAADAVTGTVDSVKDEVADLKSKGVTFEHYDMPGMTRDGDVYVSGDMKVAWFKDPDGNILNVAGR